MKIILQKSLILEQMSPDAMHAALRGETLSAADLHARALMKQGKEISTISDAQHKATFAKNMYGKTPEDLERERQHIATVNATGLMR